MTESTQVTLLRRKTRPHGPDVAENPLTSSRAVRLALTKAANDTVGLVITVQGVAEEVASLDDMLESFGDELMLIGLENEDQLTGLIAVNMEMRAAVLEMETIGALLAQTAEVRAPTRTDKTLCDPLIDAFLTAFPFSVVGTPLEGWLEGCRPAAQVESTRAAGLVLSEGDYRIVRMTVDLGVAERQGELVIALPLLQEDGPIETAPPPIVDWQADFRGVVEDAPAALNAQLHRFHISLATAQSLEVGSVLPLTGCTVNSVLLLAPDGQQVAQAKLGQAGGYRAVRLEAAPAPQLADLATQANEPANPLIDPILSPEIAKLPDANDAASDAMAPLADETVPFAMPEEMPDLDAQSLEAELP